MHHAVVKPVMYSSVMPKLWTETIDAHRRAVRDATLDTAAALAARHGLRSVTMSQIAEETGIGRATLYKYFPDVESILVAWLERLIAGHLEHLAEVRDRLTEPGQRLEAVLEAYALIRHRSHRHRDPDLAAVLHQNERIVQSERKLHDLIRDVIAEGATTGIVRTDVTPDELATYCLSALDAAGSLGSLAAAHRLVAVTLAGLRVAP
jgi:AcrR family transcriptional regulator